MSAIEPLLQQPVAQAIGWALIHFVWQGALIGALAAVALFALRRSAADIRYVVAAIALALMATMPVVTGVQTWRSVTHARAATRSDPAAVSSVDSPAVPDARSTWTGSAGSDPVVQSASSWRIVRPGNIEPWLPMFVVVWLTGVAALTVRLLGGWLWIQRMKSHGAQRAGQDLQMMVARLSRRLHISRRVNLLLSPGVEVPTVIGWLKPVILVPVGALAGLSPLQVEAILAHELAHIRRHDYLVNLLQTLLETLLFYHPAVWWLSNRIRNERENCCDDLAVSLCGDPVAYARALADLEEHRGAPVQLVLAASGGTLLHRVRRLLLPRPASHAGRGPVWLAGATALLLMTGVALAAVSQDDLAFSSSIQWPAPPPPPPAPPAPPQWPDSPALLAPAAPAEWPALPALPASAPLAPPDAPLLPDVLEPGSAPPAPPAPPATPVRVPGAAQAVPAAPTPPSAPAAPAAPAAPPGIQGSITRDSGGHSSGNFSWSNNGDRLDVNYRGEFEFTDDDLDVKRMSPGAQLRISDGGWFKGKSVEFSADQSGQISRRYWSGSSERPFDPEGRQWLSQTLPRFIRQTGIGANARVARILKNGGPSAVLAEISRIDGSWAKRVYFTALINAGSLDQATLTHVLEQAGREMDSDYELASLLIGSGEQLIASDATRKAYFDAARTIESDYEMRRVYASALKRGPVKAAILGSMLEASRGIDSDYEQAELLTQVVKQQPIDSAQAQFFAAVETIESGYERSRVLKALLSRGDLSQESLLAVLRATRGIDGGYETSQVLQTLARNYAITGPARDLYVATAERLGDYEQAQALAALAKKRF
jgi:beta-lactamase regulating signal transducer with metallopeptidase domain